MAKEKVLEKKVVIGPVQLGSGFLSDCGRDKSQFLSLADQLVWLSGVAHGMSGNDDPESHVNMLVEYGGNEYVVTDLGYNCEAQTLRLRIHQVGIGVAYFLAVQHEGEANTFIPPTNSAALDVFARLLTDGKWTIAI